MPPASSASRCKNCSRPWGAQAIAAKTALETALGIALPSRQSVKACGRANVAALVRLSSLAPLIARCGLGRGVRSPFQARPTGDPPDRRAGRPPRRVKLPQGGPAREQFLPAAVAERSARPVRWRRGAPVAGLSPKSRGSRRGGRRSRGRRCRPRRGRWRPGIRGRAVACQQIERLPELGGAVVHDDADEEAAFAAIEVVEGLA
ncbi:hypothetical protein BH23VER1_BH23VER1_02530 [soil metagenome]